MMLTFMLTDQIPSGKNQQEERWVEHVKVKGGRAYKTKKKVLAGNPRFTAWKNAAGMELLLQKRKLPVAERMALPLRTALRMTVKYRPLDKTSRDVVGMCDALQHLLEHMEIIENDKQITHLTFETGHPLAACAVISLEVL